MYSMNGFMDLALREAEKAAAAGEVPVGAVLVDGASRQVIAADHNRTEALGDPLAHAELLVLRSAIAARGGRLEGCDLYVTLEPCAMCAGAIVHVRLRRLYYAADDAKGGGVAHGARVFSQPTCNHRPEIYGGIAAEPAAKLLRDFFQARRG
jgi:tRNA(adenine34) deaminase